MAETAEAVEAKQQDAVDGDAAAKTKVQQAEFSEAGEGSPTTGAGSIDLLLDMDVPVTASIGRAEIPIRQLLQLGPGSVLKLEKHIDEPADLYLKGARFARGNVVVVDNRFAVRIQEIVGSTPAAEPAQ